ncbi:VRR-NUC domain-containing protein [Dickeya phage Amaethon]|nr:VRR-NUC domain-containing protein [Dickeya phage Amaethon]
MGAETRLQSKIIDWLTTHHFKAIKVIVSSVSGTCDIIACSPKGRYIAIEVKWGSNTTSALQDEFIEQINKRDGIAFATWDLETVIARLSGEIDGGYDGSDEQEDGPVFL